MEVFVDFGLFEVLAALGLAAAARLVYSRRLIGIGVLLLSLGAPAILIFVVPEGAPRWLAALTLGMALLNATVVFGALQDEAVPRLLRHVRWRRTAGPKAPGAAR
jgi:hypothetical protein